MSASRELSPDWVLSSFIPSSGDSRDEIMARSWLKLDGSNISIYLRNRSGTGGGGCSIACSSAQSAGPKKIKHY
jgi:hypothetical protein